MSDEEYKNNHTVYEKVLDEKNIQIGKLEEENERLKNIKCPHCQAIDFKVHLGNIYCNFCGECWYSEENCGSDEVLKSRKKIKELEKDASDWEDIAHEYHVKADELEEELKKKDKTLTECLHNEVKLSNLVESLEKYSVDLEKQLTMKQDRIDKVLNVKIYKLEQELEEAKAPTDPDDESYSYIVVRLKETQKQLARLQGSIDKLIELTGEVFLTESMIRNVVKEFESDNNEQKTTARNKK